jgi:hypothetical protein
VQIDRVERFPAATDRRQEGHIAAVVQRRRVEAGECSRRQARRRAAAERYGASPRALRHEHALHALAARDRRRERDHARLVQGWDRMLPESGDRPYSADGITFLGHLRDARSGGQEDALTASRAGESREECDLALAVHRRDNGHRLDAEAIECASAGCWLAGDDDGA